jgi:hypothetical protein
VKNIDLLGERRANEQAQMSESSDCDERNEDCRYDTDPWTWRTCMFWCLYLELGLLMGWDQLRSGGPCLDMMSRRTPEKQIGREDTSTLGDARGERHGSMPATERYLMNEYSQNYNMRLYGSVEVSSSSLTRRCETVP